MGKIYILCAAVMYKTQVVPGRRHKNCDQVISFLIEKPYESDRSSQGFITNFGKFVDRKEAYKIAYAADQIIGPNKGCPDNEIGLTSEDLY